MSRRTFVNIFFFFLLSFSFFCAKLTSAVSVASILSNIKISVCGDGVAEDPEDCDNLDLFGQTCQSLGLTSGNLDCDIACEYDITGCLGTPTPTPTPTSTPTPTPTPTGTPTPTSTPTPIPPPTGTPAPTPTGTSETNVVQTSTPAPTTPTIVLPSPTPKLPPGIAVYDLNSNDKLEVGELFLVVKNWVDDWRQSLSLSRKTATRKYGDSCDLNGDENCDIIDLSILLFYIDR